MWLRVLLLVSALALAGIGQFVLIQENDRLHDTAVALEETTTEEIDISRLILAQVRDLVHRGSTADTSELETSLEADIRHLEGLHARRASLVTQAPGPPVPAGVDDRVGAMVLATEQILGPDGPAAHTQDRLEDLERLQGELSTLLAADQETRLQAIQAESAQNQVWSFTILGGILLLLLLAATHVVRPAIDHIQQRETRFEGDLQALHGKMAAERAAAEERERELESTIEDLEQFAYVASHDLQEPLRMVGSYVQLLDARIGDELDEEAHEFMGYVLEGVERMKQLIDDLLVYSRVGTQGTELEPTDLGAAMEAALTNLTVAREETEAEITMDDLPRVLGDSSQLTQLFQNLLSNAIKFQPEGQRPRIHIGAEQAEDGTWTISVADNGIGIVEDQRERIFVIFQRSQARDAFPGTGIGLAICKKIVDRHEGRIWVESDRFGKTPASGNADPSPAEPGEGATFHVTLKPAPDPVPDEPDGAPSRDRSVRDRSRELI